MISFPNGQYCVSSGNQSLDQILGGGIPLGTIVVLYEDNQSQYYSHFLKTILGEGIVHGNQCMIVDSKDSFRSKDAWLKFLPNVSKLGGKDTKEKEKQLNEEKKIEDLEVAWRYNNLLLKDKNAGELDSGKAIQAMGKGVSV